MINSPLFMINRVLMAVSEGDSVVFEQQTQNNP
jgi:hypothetical protein